MVIECNSGSNKSLEDASMLQKCLTLLGYGAVGETSR